MIDEIQDLLDKYLAWLKDKTVLREIDDWIEITTPYLDHHNDYIQIYAKRHNSGYLLTDDGYTLNDLEQTGCRIQSPKRQELLKMTLNGFGVFLEDDALQVRASKENFALRKHNLIQAILAVNDMFYLATPTVKSLFYEDVVEWLDNNEIRYTPNIKFTGKSGYDHSFNFVIPKSRQQPERIIQAVNRPDRVNAQKITFAWIDTKEVRPLNAKAFAILNDTKQDISPSVVEALNNYDVRPVGWSKINSVREELTA